MDNGQSKFYVCTFKVEISLQRMRIIFGKFCEKKKRRASLGQQAPMGVRFKVNFMARTPRSRRWLNAKSNIPTTNKGEWQIKITYECLSSVSLWRSFLFKQIKLYLVIIFMPSVLCLFFQCNCVSFFCRIYLLFILRVVSSLTFWF